MTVAATLYASSFANADAALEAAGLLTPASIEPVPDAFAAAAKFESEVAAVERNLATASLPAATPDGAIQAELALRVRAVRGRLFILGYLPTDSHAPEMSPELQAAVRVFQADAGITVDGWVGEVTWGKLQDLVALEPPFDLSYWWREGAPNPTLPLVRAVQARLATVGLGPPTLPDDDWTRCEEGLRPFRAVAELLGLVPPGATERELVGVLMEHDRCIETLAETAQLSLLGLDEPAGEAEDHVRYLVRLVRAELWLRGFDVGALPQATDPVLLSAALQTYLETLPEGLRPQNPGAQARRVDRALFRLLAPDGEVNQQVADALAEFVKNNEVEVASAWKRFIAHPGQFLWDGIRRSVQWLWRRIKDLGKKVIDLAEHGIQYAKAFLWNVFRALYRPATKVLTLAKKAAVRFAQGIGDLCGGGFRTKSDRSACRLNADGDAVLVLDGVEDAKEVARRLRKASVSLAIAGLILSEVIGVFARAAQGPIGWMRLVGDMVKAGPRLVALGEKLVRD